MRRHARSRNLKTKAINGKDFAKVIEFVVDEIMRNLPGNLNKDYSADLDRFAKEMNIPEDMKRELESYFNPEFLADFIITDAETYVEQDYETGDDRFIEELGMDFEEFFRLVDNNDIEAVINAVYGSTIWNWIEDNIIEALWEIYNIYSED